MDNSVHIYDTTLRDGTQGEGVSLSVADKVRIAERLDDFGVSYIEGGWPGSNPRDVAFFEAMKGKTLKHAKIAAFGSTRRAGNKPEDDVNLNLLIESETPVCTIFGKSWLLHVNDVLRISPEANLELIGDSCAYLKSHGREVIFDAEHFFDGYKDNSEYSIEALLAAANNGASTIVLCDTNGGSLPMEIEAISKTVRKKLPKDVILGIHCHNDSGCASANSLLSVSAGARHVQGTINGLGERTGNANLCTIIPGLQLKMNLACIPEASMSHLTELSNFVSDLANMTPSSNQPYVGQSAFAHKGGMHVNAVRKNASTFEHMAPEVVGNTRRILVSDLSGGTNIALKAAEHNIKLDEKSPECRKILSELKEMEAKGYEYEASDASFSLLIQKLLKKHKPFFDLDGFRVIVEKRGHDAPCLSEATIKVSVKGQTELAAAEGEGPVNALDKALRKALTPFYPEISDVTLRDFKVRILEGEDGTAAHTRVLIESGDGKDIWGTVGVSENIIEASWEALVDSVEYQLFKKRG